MKSGLDAGTGGEAIERAGHLREGAVHGNYRVHAGIETPEKVTGPPAVEGETRGGIAERQILRGIVADHVKSQALVFLGQGTRDGDEMIVAFRCKIGPVAMCYEAKVKRVLVPTV